MSIQLIYSPGSAFDLYGCNGTKVGKKVGREAEREREKQRACVYREEVHVYWAMVMQKERAQHHSGINLPDHKLSTSM